MGVLLGNQALEYVEESTEGTKPTNPAMGWLGLVGPVTLGLPQKYTTKKYLAASGSSNKLGTLANVQHTEEIEISFSCDVNGISTSDFWAKYCLGATSGTADSLPSVTFGIVLDEDGTTKYAHIEGATCKSAKLSVAEDETMVLECVFRGMDYTDFTTTDYVGTGSHASATTTTVRFKDLTTLTWNGNDFDNIGLYISALSVNVDYDLNEVKDVGNTNSTGLVTIQPKGREITVAVTGDWKDVSSIATVRNGTSGSFVIGDGTTTITVAGVIWPKVEANLDPEDTIEQEFESLEATGITVA